MVFQRAVDLAQRAPRLGWLLARLGYETALRSGSPTLLAEAKLTLGTTLNLCEHFDPAIRLLDQAEELFASQGDRSGVARCHWQRGVALRFQTHFRSAVEYLESAYSEFKILGLRPEVARVQRDLAIAYNLLEQFDRASALVAQARAFFEKASQTVEVGRCDLVIGSQLRQRTQYQQSLEVLRRAYRIFDAEGQIIDGAKARYLIALVQTQLQSYRTAQSNLEMVQGVFRSAGLPMRVAYANKDLGRVLWHLGDLDNAHGYLKKALDWFEAYGIPRHIADCSLNLGNFLYVTGDYVTAEAHYEKALSIYDQLGVKSFAARCEQNLALIHRWRGDLSQALDRLHRAARALESEKVTVWAADCHFKMADIYLALGQTETATIHTQYAREWYEREHISLSAAWCDILDAQIATLADDQGEATRMLERARRTVISVGSTWHTGLCDRLLGDALLAQCQVELARSRYEAALRRFDTLGAQVDAAACRVGLGRTYRRTGDLVQAERLLSTALDVTAGVLPEWSWQAYAELGRVAQAQGEADLALALYRHSVEALSRVRLTLPTVNLAGHLAVSRKQVYDRALALALDLAEPEPALEIVEESRALVLMGNLHRRSSPDVDDPYLGELLGRETNLRAAIAQTQQDVLRAYDQPLDSTDEARQQTSSLLETLRHKRDEHLRILQQLSASGSAQIETIEPFVWPRFREAMEKHLQIEWSALIYHWKDEELFIIYADSEAVQVFRKRISPLEQTALEMATATAPEQRTLIYQGSIFGSSPGPQFGETCRRKLYKLLIPDTVSDRLAPDRLLLVVPHGPLHHLPFQTLQNQTGFLAEQAIVSYAPSLGVLERLVRRKPQETGDDHIPRGRTLLIGLDSFQQDRSELEWTLPEIDLISAIYGDRSDCLRNAEVTRERIVDWGRSGCLIQYSTLHFATHGQLDATSGTLSGLSLWDADLVLSDIEHLRLNSPLVVLSACQSGLGKVYPGDEIAGLPQAFLAAGARSVMTSLWHIDDRSTIGLMAAYHQRIEAGVTPAIALAEAQRHAIRQSVSPYSWGAFLNIGIP